VYRNAFAEYVTLNASSVVLCKEATCTGIIQLTVDSVEGLSVMATQWTLIP
jgi:hypothetical protein